MSEQLSKDFAYTIRAERQLDGGQGGIRMTLRLRT